MQRVLVQSCGGPGHHESYVSTLASVLDADVIKCKIFSSSFLRLVKPDVLLLSTLDVDLAGFILILFIRSLLCRKTVALFIRPLRCFSDRPFPGLPKRLLFSILKFMPFARIISVVPFYIHPKISSVANTWIYDPQLWDLTLRDSSVLPSTPLSVTIGEYSNGRQVLLYVGHVSRIKGFDSLCDYVKSTDLDLCLVVAGLVPFHLVDRVNELHALGAWIENRYLSDDEILSLYGISTYVWCRYSPDYDQSSGVYGRAFQSGCIPLYRPGSVVSMIHERISGQSPSSLASESLRVLRSECSSL